MSLLSCRSHCQQWENEKSPMTRRSNSLQSKWPCAFNYYFPRQPHKLGTSCTDSAKILKTPVIFLIIQNCLLWNSPEAGWWSQEVGSLLCSMPSPRDSVLPLMMFFHLLECDPWQFGPNRHNCITSVRKGKGEGKESCCFIKVLSQWLEHNHFSLSQLQGRQVMIFSGWPHSQLNWLWGLYS